MEGRINDVSALIPDLRNKLGRMKSEVLCGLLGDPEVHLVTLGHDIRYLSRGICLHINSNWGNVERGKLAISPSQVQCVASEHCHWELVICLQRSLHNVLHDSQFGTTMHSTRCQDMSLLRACRFSCRCWPIV